MIKEWLKGSKEYYAEKKWGYELKLQDIDIEITKLQIQRMKITDDINLMEHQYQHSEWEYMMIVKEANS
jgi:hypothetical protein